MGGFPVKIQLFAAAAAAALTVSMTTSAAFAFCESGEIVVKFAHVVAAKGSPKGETATALAERVNSEMNGKLCMEVYPNSQLYNDDKVLEAMLLGDAQLAAPSLSKFEKYTKKFSIFDLPFLFEDIDAVDRFQSGEAGQDLLRSMEGNGLLGLGYWHNGMKQISAKKPLLTPEDAKGLKFRIQRSDVLEAQFQALDANPQKLAFSEVYGALQTGVVDGQENTWSNIYTKKFHEVQDGITESNHGIIDYLLVTSVEFWESLPDDVREQFSTIIQEETAKGNALANKLGVESRQKILDSGGEIRELTAEQRASWSKAMEPVWAQFEGDIGADLIEAAKAANTGS
ncbi:MAG: DctP family TRAP transporter solute-binding subunit [Kiloniellaceae bacterium]|nr:DctP family TRAP transporter solute-binding subunit [Kiloniellaceae bacterium]